MTHKNQILTQFKPIATSELFPKKTVAVDLIDYLNDLVFPLLLRDVPKPVVIHLMVFVVITSLVGVVGTTIIVCQSHHEETT